MDYDIPKSVEQCREKLREEFLKHKNVSDIRVIDMLVIKVSQLSRFLQFLPDVDFFVPFRVRWN